MAAQGKRGAVGAGWCGGIALRKNGTSPFNRGPGVNRDLLPVCAAVLPVAHWGLYLPAHVVALDCGLICASSCSGTAPSMAN